MKFLVFIFIIFNFCFSYAGRSEAGYQKTSKLNMKHVNGLVERMMSNETLKEHGFTKLHIASAIGRSDIIKFLIRKGFDVNALSERGYSPLHLCAVVVGMVKFLNELPRDLSYTKEEIERDNFIKSIGKVDITGSLETLILSGAKVNAKSKLGATPLDMLYYMRKAKHGNELHEQYRKIKNKKGRRIFLTKKPYGDFIQVEKTLKKYGALKGSGNVSDAKFL